MTELLARVRRRLRLAWGSATAQVLLPVVAGVVLLLVVVGRLRPWAWPEPAALAVGLAALVGVPVVALVMRVPDLVAARAADRGLRTKDAFATALALQSRGLDADGFGPPVRERAERLARGATAKQAVPLRWQRWRLVSGAGVLALAVPLAVLPNHQDDVRRAREAELAAIDAVADSLLEQAAELADRPDATEADRAEAEALERAAEQLEQASSLEEAQEALQQARDELAAQVGAAVESQRAAARGLERTLESQPLPGAAGADAAEQLRDAADALSQLSAEEQAALTDRLDELAEGQQVANPVLAEALAVAAGALRGGDVAGAQAAL
ncbi:MAG: hypothetical protein ACRD0G_05810, partial [Acidimicrobiales bacterium]